MDFSNILRRLRSERNVSQAFMAEMLSISKQAYSNYERGIREPDYQTLCTLADFFLISVDAMVGRPSQEEQELLRRAQSEREERECRLKISLNEKHTRLTRQEKRMLHMFRALTDSEKKEIFTYLKVKTFTKLHIDEFSEEFEEFDEGLKETPSLAEDANTGNPNNIENEDESEKRALSS